MRKRIAIIAVLAIAVMGVFLACSVVVAVSFDTNGGSEVQTQHLSSGRKATLPAEPTKQGHTFAGWFSDAALSNPFDFEKTKITKDTKVFAAWSINSYTISFETSGSPVETITLPFGTPLEIFESYLSGHVFAGWFEDSALKTAFTHEQMPDRDLKLYAAWTKDNDYSAFTFEKNPTGYTLVAVRDIKLNLLCVPSTYNNQPVNRVGRAGFKQARQITRIELPDSVEFVDESAFEGCGALVSVRLPVLETVSARMFYGCTSLKTVGLFDGARVIGKNAFHGCTSLSTLALPSTLTAVEERAFSESGITFVSIPRGVKTLGADLFYGCGKLETVEFEGVNNRSGSSKSNGINSKANESSVNSNGINSKANESSVNSNGINSKANESCINSNGYDDNAIVSGTSIGSGIERLESGVFEKCTALTSIKIPEGVTFIGAYAFSGCTALSSVSLPATLQTLGDFVFFDCKSLESISLPAAISSAGSYTFLNCTKLKNVALPPSLTALDKGIFDGCTSLRNITLPSGLLSIGEGAFHGCSLLAAVSFPNSLISIGLRAFYGCKSLSTVSFFSAGINNLIDVGGYAFSGTAWLVAQGTAADVYVGNVLCRPGSDFSGLKNGTVAIAGNAFFGRKDIFSIDLSGVERIGDSAFENSSLEQLQLPSTLITVGDSAFRNNRNLGRVDFFCGASSIEGLWHIGAEAFYGCDLIEEISLPDSLRSIGESAFAFCSSLASFSLPQNKRFSFLPEGMFSGCVSLGEIDLSGITGIGKSAFFGAKSLSNVVFGECLKYIDISAFEGCESLSEIELPDSLDDIYAYAFKNAGLIRVTIGSGISSIGEQAFVSPFTQSVVFGAGAGYEPRGMTVVMTGSPTVDQSFDVGQHLRIILPDSLYGQIQESRFFETGFDGWKAYKPYAYSFSMIQDGFVISGTRVVAYLGSNQSSSNQSINQDGTNHNEEDGTNQGAEENDGALKIPDVITAIGAYAFYGCDYNGGLVIPNSVTSIALRAFYGCKGITALELSENLETVADSAFRGMESLAEITLPALKSIGATVFSGCTSLSYIYCKLPQSQSAGWNTNWKGDCAAQVFWNR